MKRTHKRSKITFLNNDFMDTCYPPKSKTYEAINGYILQVEELNGVYAVEYLQPEDVEEYQHSADATPEKNIVDMEYENALTTVLNNDPRGQFSGKTLKEIFDAPNGKEWVEWALANMKNKFIVERVRAIYNHNNCGAKQWQL